MEYMSKKDILNSINSSNEIWPGMKCNYELFKEIYKTYEEFLPEKNFAKLLEISDAVYNKFKIHNIQNVTILKSKILTKQQILEQMDNEGKIGTRQIDYKTFKEMYKKYSGSVSEKQFAELLEIKRRVFENMKEKNENAYIFTSKMITSGKLKEELLVKRNLKSGDYISYVKLHEAYLDYSEQMTEVKFAEMLGIKSSSFYNIKKRGHKTKITFEACEEHEKIVNELLQNNIIKPGQRLSYKSFLEIFDKYKDEIQENELASLLEISYSNYLTIKNKGTNAIILKSKIEKKEKTRNKNADKSKIFETLIENKEIEIGKRISYKRFKDLYNRYGNTINEMEFAKILGIEERLYNMKKQDIFPIIKNGLIQQECEIIKFIIDKEKRFYSAEEIMKICKDFNITIDDFIVYVVNNGRSIKTEDYKELLQTKRKIWIGRTKMTKDFLSKHSNELIKLATKITMQLADKFQRRDLVTEFSSETLIFLMDKCGDIEKNFGDDTQKFNKSLFFRTMKNMYEKFYNEVIYSESKISLTINDELEERDILDDSKNVEDIIEQKEIEEK